MGGFVEKQRWRTDDKVAVRIFLRTDMVWPFCTSVAHCRAALLSDCALFLTVGVVRMGKITLC